MELWGGIECTINRIGNQYVDQLDLSGHYTRPSDIEDFTVLGFKAIRYPILWERHQPDAGSIIDWTLTAKKLAVFQQSGIEVIAGLVHHGSGPSFVSILDDSFANGLADYARAVAARFPWIINYTPVNEPLTTARFCGLYGLWYPHEKSDTAFLRILINECRATILAMKAIREVNPRAKLIQTEDIGKIHSTPALSYQSDFENQRRWLSYDLLSGRVDNTHKLYGYLIANGITESELDEIKENTLPPDILGINYYITSERYLDDDYKKYPEALHGGNGVDRYADIEAVRNSAVEMDGPERIFEQVWKRYHLPMAITEVHLHCGREDQLRWLKFIWVAAEKLNEQGADIRAVTLWCLLGAYGWNSLLTKGFEHYEPGAFDVRSGFARETAIAQMARQLAHGNMGFHPVVEGKGWWEMPGRVVYGNLLSSPALTDGKSCSPILVLGMETPIGKQFIEICKHRNLAVCGINSLAMPDDTIDLLPKLIEQHKPWAVINAQGFSNIDYAEWDALRCYRDNALMVKNLAMVCRVKGVQLLIFSSDMVFDGAKRGAYNETDMTNPLNLFGKTMVQAEHFASEIYPSTLIVRNGALFEDFSTPKLLQGGMPFMKSGRNIFVPQDIYFSACFLPEMVGVCLDLLIDREHGIWHLCNTGKLSWFEFARLLADMHCGKKLKIKPINIGEMPNPALRPQSCALKSNRGDLMSKIESVLAIPKFK